MPLNRRTGEPWPEPRPLDEQEWFNLEDVLFNQRIKFDP
jgi:hypothetical protein